MTCSRIQELISPFLDGMLSPEENSLVRNHLEACESCRTELGGLKNTVHLFQSLGDIPLPQNFSAELHEKLAAAKGEMALEAAGKSKDVVSYRIPRFHWLSLGVAAAVLMVFLMVSGLPFFPQTKPQESGVQSLAPEDAPKVESAASDLKKSDIAVQEEAPPQRKLRGASDQDETTGENSGQISKEEKTFTSKDWIKLFVFFALGIVVIISLGKVIFFRGKKNNRSDE